MAEETAAQKVLRERQNKVLKVRWKQIQINLLGLYGGRPYVDARLSRFAGESPVDWSGGHRDNGTVVAGRKQQAHCIPYLARIAEKINQHILGKAPDRTSIDPLVAKDITNDGQGINQFMREVGSLVTSCGWCWIGIDAPKSDGSQLSIARKQAQNVRPYWSLYNALEVVDWFFNPRNGKLEWLVTETVRTEDANPFTAASAFKVRSLWQPGKVTVFTFGKDGKIENQEVIPLSLEDRVPFVLAGSISKKPHQFDNLESINRTIMDLESCNRQNFFNTVFPQMFLPMSVLEAVMDKFSKTAEEAVSLIMGYNYPILLADGDPQPGYMMPESTSVKSIGEENERLRREMFDTVGLMMQQETRQVESAEAKAWDFLDVQAVLNERANILEEAEQKAVDVTKAWDSDFKEWEPVYNRDFAIVDFKAQMETLVMSGNVSQPDSMIRFALQRQFEVLKNSGSGKIDSETEQQILDDINAFSVSSEFIG